MRMPISVMSASERRPLRTFFSSSGRSRTDATWAPGEEQAAASTMAIATCFHMAGQINRCLTPISRVSSLAARAKQRAADECHDKDIQHKRRGAEPRRMASEPVDLEWYVDRAAHGRKPLGPCAPEPQPVGFGESHQGIG